MDSGITVRTRVDLRIDSSLKAWATRYAKKNNKTLTDLICDLLETLRVAEQKKQPGEVVEQF